MSGASRSINAAYGIVRKLRIDEATMPFRIIKSTDCRPFGGRLGKTANGCGYESQVPTIDVVDVGNSLGDSRHDGLSLVVLHKSRVGRIHGAKLLNWRRL